jgi:geranylgeranylglycerol-phosphate geranylgeranyltransferase
MTGGLSLLTAFAIIKDPMSITLQTAVLIFFSMALITSAGFAINDYFDRESDAIIKPKRPIPAGTLTLKQVIAISSILFTVGLGLTYWLPPLSFAILAVDSIVLVLYSYIVKKKSGFIANIIVGILTGTAFMYGQAALSGTVTMISFSLYPIAFGTIGGNVLRDVVSVEGDAKVGYPTLPQKIGNYNASKVGAFFFFLTGLLAPLPFFSGNFTIFYLPLILVWSILLIYSSVRLFISGSTVQNVRKYERIVTMSMILLPLALIVEAIVGWLI